MEETAEKQLFLPPSHSPILPMSAAAHPDFPKHFLCFIFMESRKQLALWDLHAFEVKAEQL